MVSHEALQRTDPLVKGCHGTPKSIQSKAAEDLQKVAIPQASHDIAATDGAVHLLGKMLCAKRGKRRIYWKVALATLPCYDCRRVAWNLDWSQLVGTRSGVLHRRTAIQA